MIKEIFLIVGLGNPGAEYSRTRHNIGFMFIDCLTNKLGLPEFKEKFDALCSDITLNNNKIIVIKPQTYMNLSGKSVQQFVSFYKIKTENVFVIHDDLDLKIHDVRIKFAGSSSGHNGIKNIDSLIKNEYWRIRIGIGRPENNENIKDYVLSDFNKQELTEFNEIFEIISNHIEDLLLAENPKAQVISDIKSDINAR